MASSCFFWRFESGVLGKSICQLVPHLCSCCSCPCVFTATRTCWACSYQKLILFGTFLKQQQQQSHWQCCSHRSRQISHQTPDDIFSTVRYSPPAISGFRQLAYVAVELVTSHCLAGFRGQVVLEVFTLKIRNNHSHFWFLQKTWHISVPGSEYE